MKNLFRGSVLLVAFAAAPAFADTPSVVSATVPGQCQITSADDINVTFGLGNANAVGTGNIYVLCNKDDQFQLTASGIDASGRFNVTSGIDSMQAELRSLTTGYVWYDTYYVNGIGTGVPQDYGFEVNFNPDAAYLPGSGTYSATIFFNLAAL